MSGRTRKNLIKTADMLERVADGLIEIISIGAVIFGTTLAYAIEFIITGKVKRPKANRPYQPRPIVQRTVIYRQSVPRSHIVDNQR